MNAVNRYLKYQEDDLDEIIVKIRNGSIKCGRYAHLVKVKKQDKVKGKELFTNAKNKED